MSKLSLLLVVPVCVALFEACTAIIEVTPRGEMVWRMELKDIILERNQAPMRGFYKAERIGVQK